MRALRVARSGNHALTTPTLHPEEPKPWCHATLDFKSASGLLMMPSQHNVPARDGPAIDFVQLNGELRRAPL